MQKSLCQTNQLTVKSGASLANAFEELRLAKAPGAICPPSPGNNPRFYKVEPTEKYHKLTQGPSIYYIRMFLALF